METSPAWLGVWDGGLKWPACSKDTDLQEDRDEGSGCWPGGSFLTSSPTKDPPHPALLSKKISLSIPVLSVLPSLPTSCPWSEGPP